MKKTISTLLALIIIFAANAHADNGTALNSQETNILETDTEKTEESRKVTDYSNDESLTVASALISSLGIETESSPAVLSAPVSRAEFIKILVTLMTNSNYGNFDCPFNDISDENVKKYAAYAVNADIISRGDTFRPKDNVTYNEAIKMSVSSAGYNDRAKINGGYPYGYIKLANSLKITNDLNGAAQGFTLRDAYVLIYNTLRTDLYVSYYSDGDIKYTSNDGDNTLKMTYDIYETEGIVYADSFTYLTDGEKSLGDDSIMIENDSYNVKFFIKDLIGKNVHAYYYKNGRKIVSAVPVDNETRTVTTDNFDEINGSVISVTEDNKTKKYKLNPSYNLIINGKACVKRLNELSKIISDNEVTAELIDNNSDGAYDVINLKNWQYCYVSKVDSYNGYIYDKYSNDNIIDLSSDRVKYEIKNISTGEILSLSDIKNDTLLSYAKSSAGDKYEIYVLNNKINGKLDGISNDGDIKINDELYRVGNYCSSNCKVTGVGKDCAGILGMNGEIVFLTVSTGEDNYCWIVSIASKGIDGTQIKYFASDGKMHISDISDKLTVDGKKYKGNLFDLFTDTMTDEQRFVRYSLDKDGNFANVDFADENTDLIEFDENKNEKDCHKLFYTSGDTRAKYSDSKNFEGKLTTMTATVFIIPTVDNRNDDDNYLITDTSYFGHNGSYKIRAYNSDSLGNVGQIVCISDNTSSALSYSTRSAVVQNISYGQDNSGDECYIMNVYIDKSYKTLIINTKLNEIASQISAGDIVRYAVNKGTGIVDNMVLDYSFKNDMIYDETDNIWSSICFSKGIVYDCGLNSMRIIKGKKSVDSVPVSSDLLTLPISSNKLAIVYVTIQNGKIKNAVVKPTGISSISCWKTAGNNADYAIVRTDTLRITDTVVYVVNRN